MAKQNSQTSNSTKLLKALAEEVWKQDDLPGDLLTPTLTDIQKMAIATPETEKGVSVASMLTYYRVIVLKHDDIGAFELHTNRAILNHDARHPERCPVDEEDLKKYFPNATDVFTVGISIREGCDVPPKEYNTVIVQGKDEAKKYFSLISRHIIRTAGEPSQEQLKWIHELWKDQWKDDVEHPIIDVVRAWIQTQTTTRITNEHDRKYPVAVLKHRLGSVRELAFTENDTGEVFQTPERVDQIQMELDLGGDASILPAIMPLQVVRTANLKPQTKSGAVSHELRIFFEAMMALQPNQRRADLMFRLGDLIDFLYPNGKFHWTNQMPHIKRALRVLHTYATVPWIDDQGSLREWRPVAVRTPLIDEATRDTPIYIEVQMPPDARRGHMVIKDVHRKIGMKSAAQWNAYHVAAYLWDKYGTVKGKLVDPTRPIEMRDDQNRLVDATGKPLVNKNGKEIKSPYHSEAIKQLEREPNLDAIQRYPVLSSEDLILACFPNGYPDKSRREYLSRAKTHWQRLEDDGIIVIHKERGGWRIFPPTEHLNAHRALRKSAKGVY